MDEVSATFFFSLSQQNTNRLYNYFLQALRHIPLTRQCFPAACYQLLLHDTQTSAKEHCSLPWEKKLPSARRFSKISD